MLAEKGVLSFKAFLLDYAPLNGIKTYPADCAQFTRMGRRGIERVRHSWNSSPRPDISADQLLQFFMEGWYQPILLYLRIQFS